MAEAVNKPKGGRLGEYLRGVRTEFKKVVWPTKKETKNYTVAVFVICALFALLFFLMDTGILFILAKVLGVAV